MNIHQCTYDCLIMTESLSCVSSVLSYLFIIVIHCEYMYCYCGMFHSQDRQGHGTVTEYDAPYVCVKWDNGKEPIGYLMGFNGTYNLTLADSISEEEKMRFEEEKERAVREDAGKS